MYCHRCNSDYLEVHGCFCERIKEPHPVLLKKPELDPLRIGTMDRYKPAMEGAHLGAVEL